MFVVFEGPEGSGKTTQIELLARALEAEGQAVLRTREPGGTAIGEQIRTVLHDVENRAMLPLTEALLYSAARAQLVGQELRPALQRGEVVICDRYFYSTLAYQGYGHGLDLEMLRELTRWVTDGLEPDLVVYLDLEVAEGLRRKRAAERDGRGEYNRMDRLEVDFHRAVRQGYLRMAESAAGRWLVLDAARPIETLHRQICARIRELQAASDSGR